jgi:hypothetical protein
MSIKPAVVARIALAPQRAPAREESAVDALRRRLAGLSSKEHVVLDFLEDDLRETRAALGALAAWLANVESALADDAAPGERLLSLAAGSGPPERLDDLTVALSSVRRRLAQVGVRM